MSEEEWRDYIRREMPKKQKQKYGASYGHLEEEKRKKRKKEEEKRIHEKERAEKERLDREREELAQRALKEDQDKARERLERGWMDFEAKISGSEKQGSFLQIVFDDIPFPNIEVSLSYLTSSLAVPQK